jgi:hypothetical protein
VTERKKVPELEPELVTTYANTFISRWDCYHKQLETGKYARVSRPLTLNHVLNHLYGLANMTLGVYALSVESTAKWVCIDADDERQYQGLKDLTLHLAQQGQGAYLERSSRGGHLWMFFSTPLSGYSARRFALTVGIETHLDPHIEIYPKQDHLSDDGYGSLVRLPLGVHRKTHIRYHFVTLDDKPIAPTIRDQIKLLAEPDFISTDYIDHMLSIAPKWETPSPTKPFQKREGSINVPLSESIKGAISVKAFVSNYVHLNDKGIGLCPFHEDHEPSFGVNDEGNYWSCFKGCGGGSIIDFWMKWRQKDGQDGSFTPTLLQLREMFIQPPRPKSTKRKKKPST